MRRPSTPKTSGCGEFSLWLQRGRQQKKDETKVSTGTGGFNNGVNCSSSNSISQYCFTFHVTSMQIQLQNSIQEFQEFQEFRENCEQ